MIVSKDDIQRFLPHRPPFLMVDKLITVDPKLFESEFYIDQNNVLVENGIFLEGGLIENIAQTCAASFGFLDKDKNQSPKIGFIGAVSRVTVHGFPAAGSTIFTSVIPTHQLGNIFMVQGRNYQDGHLLLECEMKIVVNE